jgi:hypothetical protein
MAEVHVTLSEEERAFLADFLEQALKEVLVEEHRTRSLTYRDNVLRQEQLIKAVLSKLGRAPT